MITMKRISSVNKNRFIDVVKLDDGSFVLQKFVEKYDPEEDASYVVRELPDPTGRFGELGLAVDEAERLVK